MLSCYQTPARRGMYKHFCDTPRNPCGLCRDILVTEGHSRVHTCYGFEKVE